MNTTLSDPHGRSITYLRLSITDRCDVRCVYCMSEDMTFLPRSEVLERIAAHYSLLRSHDDTGGPARYYRMADSPIRVGVISPHSNNFCASCNRVRVTDSGRLLLCLGNEHAVELRPLLKAGQPLDKTLLEAMAAKPEKHHFDLQEPVSILRFMNMTGG